MRLGPVGVWLGGYGFAADDDRRNAAEIERLGYSALWFGEAPGGKEAFTRAAVMLAATDSLIVATGIASIWGRDPLNTASAIRTVGESFAGRFVAGLGVSHPPAVEARGEEYRAPLSMMRQHLADMAQATHQSPEPAEAPPVVLAALRPKMLELAARCGRRSASVLRPRRAHASRTCDPRAGKAAGTGARRRARARSR